MQVGDQISGTRSLRVDPREGRLGVDHGVDIASHGVWLGAVISLSGVAHERHTVDSRDAERAHVRIKTFNFNNNQMRRGKWNTKLVNPLPKAEAARDVHKVDGMAVRLRLFGIAYMHGATSWETA